MATYPHNFHHLETLGSDIHTYFDYIHCSHEDSLMVSNILKGNAKNTYSNTLNSAHFGTGNFPHYSKSALFEVTVM